MWASMLENLALLQAIIYFWKKHWMHAQIQKVFSEGVQFFWCFFVCFFSWLGENWSKYHYKHAIMGPPAKRHLNGFLLAGRWWPNTECWLVSFAVLQGIQTNIAKKPYIFVIFQGGGGSQPPVPPLWICTWIVGTHRTLTHSFTHSLSCILNLYFSHKNLSI